MACEVVLASGQPLPVGTDHMSVHVDLHPTPRSPALARRFVAEQLGDLPPELVDTAQLVASELVTNGVLHAHTALQLGVTRTVDHVLLTVHDDNAELPHELPPNTGRRHGRGISILSQLAEQVGWQPTSSGKTVWALLPA